ncbi:MAG: hypothetical protein ACKOCK_03930, partial [Chloroflexota bacterium]
NVVFFLRKESFLMDGSSFDRITPRFAVTTQPRGGLAPQRAGALGIAGVSSADARLDLPPRCRNAGSPCQTNDVCCSGRCIAKPDGSMRCARTTTNRPKKKKKKDKADSGGGGVTCGVLGTPCVDPVGSRFPGPPEPVVCCQDFICVTQPSLDKVCKPCADAGDHCGSSTPCCTGTCQFDVGAGTNTCQ